MVEEEDAKEANSRPETADETEPPPASMVCDQLTPENRWAEGNDGEYENSDIFASLAGWSKFRGYGKRGEFAYTGATAREGESH